MSPVSGPIQLGMVGTWLFDDSIDVLWTVTELEIDPAQFDGVQTATLIAVARNMSGYNQYSSSETKHIYLVDDEDTLYATLEIPTGTRGDSRTFASQLLMQTFDLNPAKTKYYLKTDGSSEASSALSFRFAAIELQVSNATKARPQIMLLQGDESSGGGYADEAVNNLWAYAVATQNPTYGYGGATGNSPQWFRRFYLDKSKWSSVDSWELEVIATPHHRNEGQGPGKAALFNCTTGLMVPGSELEFDDEDVQTRKTATIADAVMADATEYELRAMLTGGSAGEGFDSFFLARAALYPTLTLLSAMESHIQVGTVTGGYASGSGPIDDDERFDPNARLHFDASKFSVGTPIYLECCAREYGTAASLFLYDCGEEDQGLPVIIGEGQAVGDAGPYTNPTKVLAADNDPALWSSSTSGETAEIRVDGFVFSGAIPAGMALNQVEVQAIGAVWQQNSYAAAKINSSAYVSQLRPWQANPGLSGMAFTIPGAWDIATLESATSTFRWTHPTNTTPTDFALDYVALRVSYGGDITESALNFGASHERQRSGDLSTVLQDGHRYIMHTTATAGAGSDASISAHTASFIIAELSGEAVPICLGVAASIDHETMLISGTGSGANATQWKVIRVSDDAIMDGGAGDEAEFAFTGEYGVQYQLQFGDAENNFSTSGCLFTMYALPECLGVDASIDAATKIITGSGTGQNADRWRVVRVSDGTVMASGDGAAAEFTFVGEYGVQYQLQFGYSA